MSTATYDRPPLYAVPNREGQQVQFGLLLAIRRHARQALDTILALPRGAAGWVVRQMRTLLAGIGQHHLLDQATALLRNGISFVRRVGVIPLVATVLTTPPVWRTAVGWARAAGTALARFGRGLWARTKDLLTRSGTTGARIAQALSRAGTTVVAAAHAVASHPVIQQVIHAVRSLAGLVRALSQTVLVHRLLGLLVPALWLRVALEALALPLVIALGMPGVVRPSGSNGPAPVAPKGEPAMPTAEGADASPTDADVVGPWTREEEDRAEPLNRAERRAQQQEQARARRSHTRR
jgi:hypothetical protein